jgi:hypothetical protein
VFGKHNPHPALPLCGIATLSPEGPTIANPRIYRGMFTFPKSAARGRPRHLIKTTKC